MGPIGSGKTGACVAKLLTLACEQGRSPVDGVRYSRWVVLRDTYRRINRTVLPSWFGWVPHDFGVFRSGGDNAPSAHHLRYQLPDGSVVDSEVMFAAIGDNDVEPFTRGFEITGGWLNEVDLLSRDVLTFLPGRTRYPSRRHGGPTFRGIICDFNAPDTDHYLRADFVDDPKPGYRLFVQPGGTDPGAENVKNLPPDYYERAAAGHDEWYVRRMIHNRWGASRDGKPVFPEFSEAQHMAPAPIEPAPGVPLRLGADAGLTPAVLIAQQLPTGQWVILDELIGDLGGIGAVRFGEALARLLRDRYPAHQVGQAWADPAGTSRASTDEESWMDAISAASGVRFRGTATNGILPRLEAVRAPLGRMIDGRPGILISPRCRTLRRALLSGYAYKRQRLPGGGERYEDVPAKSEHSHIADALQYLLLGGGEWVEATRRRQDQRDRLMGHAGGRPVVAPHDFSVW